MKFRLRWILIPILILVLVGVLLKIMDGKEADALEEVTEVPQEQGTLEEEIVIDENAPCIVVDAGHGGYDPGMVNEDGVIEKEINLQMAFVLKDTLEKAGFRVVLTRDSDEGLYEEESSGRKMQDLRNRCNIINETQPVCTISIHQNSFPDETVYGPQVFYYHTSEGSKTLAEIIQTSINESLQIEKPREAKDNGSYYILKKSPSVIALVECGFLSHKEEAKLLVSEDYQKQMAEAICQGVLTYMEGQQKDMAQEEQQEIETQENQS